MLILAVDDEPRMLRLLHDAIAEAAPKAEIRDYLRGDEVLQDIRSLGLRPDVAFCDIQMPGMNGLALAIAINACRRIPSWFLSPAIPTMPWTRIGSMPAAT